MNYFSFLHIKRIKIKHAINMYHQKYVFLINNFFSIEQCKHPLIQNHSFIKQQKNPDKMQQKIIQVECTHQMMESYNTLSLHEKSTNSTSRIYMVNMYTHSIKTSHCLKTVDFCQLP